MKFAQDDVMTWSYLERQLIVVETDEAVAAVQNAEKEDDDGDEGLEPADGVRDWFFFGLVGAAALAAARLWRARRRADRANLPVLVLTTSQAQILTFPNGHPLHDVVYVGDPGVAGSYYPVASFHRFLFESKVAEALRLLRSLGATEISIEYLEGFDRGAGFDLSVAPPTAAVAEGSGRVSRKRKTGSGVKTTMQLSPNLPARIPQDLIWFRSEPLWQEVANARLENGLQSFSIEVNYTEDFGVNAELKAKITDVGLGLGGNFTDYQETSWKLSGTFATQLSPEATTPE